MPRTVSREDVQMHSSAEGCRANILILARKFLIGGGGGAPGRPRGAHSRGRTTPPLLSDRRPPVLAPHPTGPQRH